MLQFDKIKPPATILVVEDTKNVRDSVVQVIEEMGFEVERATTEDEAVELARQHPPDLLIVNLHEPVRVDVSHPEPTVASRICERAELSNELMMVTHSGQALSVTENDHPQATFSGGHGIRVCYPRRADHSWRNECFGYTGNREWLKGFLRHWLEDERPHTHPWWSKWKWES